MGRPKYSTKKRTSGSGDAPPQSTTEGVQNAVADAPETATEYAKTADDNVLTAAVNTKEYVSEQLGVAPKEKTTGEKVEEAAASVKDRAQEGAQSVNEKAVGAVESVTAAVEDAKKPSSPRGKKAQAQKVASDAAANVSDKVDSAVESVTAAVEDAKKPSSPRGKKAQAQKAASDAAANVSDKVDSAVESVTAAVEDATKSTPRSKRAKKAANVQKTVEEAAKKARNEVTADATAAKKYASDTATRVEESAKNAKKDASDKMDTAVDRARAAQADLSGENDGFLKGYPRHTFLEKVVVAVASTGVGLVFRVGRYALTKVRLANTAGQVIAFAREASSNAFDNVDSLRGVKQTAEQYWPVRLVERMVGEVDTNVKTRLAQ